ncbi:hypothetical protein BCF74_11129 [Knoellia remsis]|uniref:Uncharacterized protein n=1 Tax=Knoellia remsis TaxID=407159 RepID=A0A2T0ULM1_9MICO|nr:hypothetical protein [Knoellia remsis]PRY58748.1 hypothetical protein BCF74_11129 [Knoellia remsis]
MTGPTSDPGGPIGPRPGGPGPEERDPTGMRELLRSLPDPGPMPDDLVARIQSRLADLPAPEEWGSEGSAQAGSGASGTPRSGWARFAPVAAVAAVALVLGGVLLAGPLGLVGGGPSLDAASSGADSAESSTGTMSRESAKSFEEQDGAPAMGSAPDEGPVVVRMSGRDYDSARLATQVPDPGDESASPTRPLAAESPAIGPIGTEIGVRSCLEALGLPAATGAQVDLGNVDGAPAAVLVVTAGGARTAYAVERRCTTGDPALLAGPIALP